MPISDASSPWPPLIQRVLSWSLTMGILWGIFPFLCGGEFGFKFWWDWAHGFPNDIPQLSGVEEGGAAPFFGLACVISVLWTLGGLIAGACAGFFAPVGEPKKPMHSEFFRYVSKHSFGRWIGSTVLLFPIGAILIQFIVNRNNGAHHAQVQLVVFSYTIAMLLAVSVWLSINGALKKRENSGYEEPWLDR